MFSMLLVQNTIQTYEVEEFVETHICKQCDTPIARVTDLCVSS